MRPLLLIPLAGLALVGCGGGDNSGSQGGNNGGSGGGGGNQTPVVRPGDRLVWDQPATTLQLLRTYTYRLYTDGVRGSLSAVTCSDTASAAGYQCTGGLPSLTAGLHSLEMTTVTANGVESARSTPFSVMVATGVSTGGLTSGVDETGRPLEVVCIGDTGSECYDPALVSSGVDAVASLVHAANDVMLFIEGQRTVRIFEGHHLTDRPALEAPSGRLLALAVPADFEHSHLVYVAASALSRAGDEELSITRYRELQGTLAEGATIVSGLPFSAHASAQMTMDSQGLLYLSIPYSDSRSPAEPNANTAILRFQSDGTVPSANPRFSPVIAHGYAHASALVWDSIGNRLWLAGDDPRVPTSVATLQPDASARAPWPWSPVGVSLQGSPDSTTTAPRVAITSDRGGRSLWVVPSPGQVFRGTVSDDRQVPLARVAFGAITDVGTVVGGPDGSLMLVSEPAPASGRPWRIWRLDRIVPKVIRLF